MTEDTRQPTGAADRTGPAESERDRAWLQHYPLLTQLFGSEAREDEALILAAWADALADTSREDLLERLVASVLNRAADRDRRAGRALDLPDTEPELATRFETADSPWAGFWRASPTAINKTRDGRRDALVQLIAQALRELPLWPRAVVVLRDFAGWDSDRVSRLFAIGAEQQRLLLSRGRDRLVHALERGAQGPRVGA